MGLKQAPYLGQGNEAHHAKSGICHVTRSQHIGKPNVGSSDWEHPPLKGLNWASQVLSAECELENTQSLSGHEAAREQG